MSRKFVVAPALAVVAAALAFWLTGCATQPPAVEPTGGVTIPPAWTEAVPSGNAPLALWWQGFGDPVLVQLVDRSQLSNTDVRIAQANLRQARALRDASAAGSWPAVSASASAQRNRSGALPDGNLFHAGFDASWEPDVFGAIGHGVDATQAQAQASAATLASTQVSIAAEVAADYLQLRGTQIRAVVARETLDVQQQTLEIAQWREQAGLGTSLESSQARSAVEQTRAALPLLDAGAVQTAHALAVLTGEPPAALHALLSTEAALPQPPQDLTVAIPAQALRQRPDVLAAEWQLRAAASRVAQADANRLPTFNLGASIAWASTTIGSLGSIAAARSLVASVSQTLFDHGQRNALLAAQQAAFDAAQETYRARVLAALQDVEDSLSALSASRDRVVALHAAVDASRDAALLAGHRYTSGLIDFQTVIDTQRTLLNVRDSVVSAEADLATGHVRLYKALGGGWSPAESKPENHL